MRVYAVNGGRRLPMSLVAWLALLSVAQLTGCAESERNGLHAWLHNERARHQPLLPPFATPADDVSAAVPAQITAHRQGVEPFNRQRLLHSLPVELATAAQPAAVPASTPSRPTPPLEASPLAGMRLVGSLQRGGQPWALLRVNGLIYSVRVGDRLGQDQGRITAITLSALELREIALDPTGQPTERIVSLALVAEP